MKSVLRYFDRRRIGALRSKGVARSQCVLFLTHKWTPSIAERHARLVANLDGVAEVLVLCDAASPEMPREMGNVLAFDMRRIERSLGYNCLERGNIVPGSAHIPLLWFAQHHACEHYWLVEYDVDFSGDWANLLDAHQHSKADLVAAHVRRYAETPDWYYWDTFRQPRRNAVPREHWIKAFLPIFRISAAGVDAVHRAHTSGYSGHAEMLVPTCLSLQGLKVEDFNGACRFYVGDEQDPVDDRAKLSTLRWLPPVEIGKEYHQADNLIYHPLK